MELNHHLLDLQTYALPLSYTSLFSYQESLYVRSSYYFSVCVWLPQRVRHLVDPALRRDSAFTYGHAPRMWLFYVP